MCRLTLAVGIPTAVLRSVQALALGWSENQSVLILPLFGVALQGIPTLAASFSIKKYSIYLLAEGCVWMNTFINIYRTFLSSRNKTPIKRLSMT